MILHGVDVDTSSLILLDGGVEQLWHARFIKHVGLLLLEVQLRVLTLLQLLPLIRQLWHDARVTNKL